MNASIPRHPRNLDSWRAVPSTSFRVSAKICQVFPAGMTGFGSFSRFPWDLGGLLCDWGGLQNDLGSLQNDWGNFPYDLVKGFYKIGSV